MIRRYVFRDGRMVDKDTGEPMNDGPVAHVPTPRIVGDIQPYLSPVTGEVIGGRAQKRADLARHGCVDSRDLPSPTGGRFRNPNFAAKRGLTHLLKEENVERS